MRKCDWTDVRDALQECKGDVSAVRNQMQKKWPAEDVTAAIKEFNEKVDDAQVEEARWRQLNAYERGQAADVAILEKNGKKIADVIRAGGKPVQSTADLEAAKRVIAAMDGNK